MQRLHLVWGWKLFPPLLLQTLTCFTVCGINCSMKFASILIPKIICIYSRLYVLLTVYISQCKIYLPWIFLQKLHEYFCWRLFLWNMKIETLESYNRSMWFSGYANCFSFLQRHFVCVFYLLYVEAMNLLISLKNNWHISSYTVLFSTLKYINKTRWGFNINNNLTATVEFTTTL